MVADVRQVACRASNPTDLAIAQVPGPTNPLNMWSGSTACLRCYRFAVDGRPDGPAAFVDNIAPMDGSCRTLTPGRGVPSCSDLCRRGHQPGGRRHYGVMALVVRRTRERIAWRLCAAPAGAALVVRDSAIVAGAGLAIGIGGAVWSSRLFEGCCLASRRSTGPYAAVRRRSRRLRCCGGDRRAGPRGGSSVSPSCRVAAMLQTSATRCVPSPATLASRSPRS